MEQREQLPALLESMTYIKQAQDELPPMLCKAETEEGG